MSTEQAAQPVARPIIGTPEGLTNALETAARQGRLVSVTAPRRHSRGRYVVTAVLLDVPPAAPRPWWRPTWRPTWQWCVPGAAVLAAVTVVALATAAVVRVLAWMAGALIWIGEHGAVIIGAAAVVLACLVALRHVAGLCMGVHRAGCGHR